LPLPPHGSVEQCIVQDFEFGGVSRVSANEVVLMCTILITVSGGFLGGVVAAEIQNEWFLIHTTVVILGYCRPYQGTCKNSLTPPMGDGVGASKVLGG